MLGALAAVVAGIAVYTHFALYADKSIVVHTAAGSYVGENRSAGAQQQVLDFVRGHTAPGDAVLALPADGGMSFLTGRDPALYEVMFLPGLLDTRADEIAAIARLKREHVRYAVISARDTSAFDTGRSAPATTACSATTCARAGWWRRSAIRTTPPAAATRRADSRSTSCPLSGRRPGTASSREGSAARAWVGVELS